MGRLTTMGDDLMAPAGPIGGGLPGEELPPPPGRRRRGEVEGGPAGPVAPVGGCPPGQQMINGKCRHAGDFPCPPNQCKDKVTGECRGFNPRREKPNETDTQERESGGGRGYCKQLEGGGMGAGAPQASLADEQQYFDRIAGAGEWTDAGGGWFYNDPGNDPTKRRWLNRSSLQLDSSGRGYLSASSRGGQMEDLGGGGGGMGGPGGGRGGVGGGDGAFPPGMPPMPPGVGGAGGAKGDISTQIRDALTAIFQGGSTRFSPEVMADITAGQKGLEQSQIQQGVEAANEDAAARGLAFSGVGAAAAGQARSKAQQTFAQGQREARQQKAFYDFEDKMGALDRAQKWLDGMRQYSLGLQQDATQREQISASILIARERIKAEAQQLAQQLGSQKDLLGMQLDSTEYLSTQSQLRCLMNPDLC